MSVFRKPRYGFADYSTLRIDFLQGIVVLRTQNFRHLAEKRQDSYLWAGIYTGVLASFSEHEFGAYLSLVRRSV